MTTPGAQADEWLMLRRDVAEFVLEALSHFGEWGFTPLDFERVRQARAALEAGLITRDGEVIKPAKAADHASAVMSAEQGSENE
jgi:hypothetical protein